MSKKKIPVGQGEVDSGSIPTTPVLKPEDLPAQEDAQAAKNQQRLEEIYADKRKMEAKYPPKKMAKGGKVSSASKRADGCAQRGKTRGKMV